MADGSKYRSPQTLQHRVREIIKHAALNEMFSKYAPPKSLGNPMEEETGGMWEPKGIEDVMKTRSSMSTEKSSYKLRG